MKTQIYARLKVLSKEFNPEKISDLLGMPYDQAWRIGDTRPKTIIVEKENGWIINSGLTPDETLDNHVQSLLKRLAPIATKIRALAENCTVDFSCVIYSTDRPPLYFERGAIHEISKLGANLDLDIYSI